jgi:hypothetical protein
MPQRPRLHPGLTAAWTLVEAVRSDLLATIRPVTAAQWTFRPTAGAWGIGDIVEHLLLAEIASSKMARKLIRGDYRNVPYPQDATLYGAELDRYPFGPLDAPAVLVPGAAREWPVVESELGPAHERFQSELAQFRGDDPEALRSPDPATAEWFTLGGWVKLQAWHEKHHLTQIRRLMASPGFLSTQSTPGGP